MTHDHQLSSQRSAGLETRRVDSTTNSPSSESQAELQRSIPVANRLNFLPENSPSAAQWRDFDKRIREELSRTQPLSWSARYAVMRDRWMATDSRIVRPAVYVALALVALSLAAVVWGLFSSWRFKPVATLSFSAVVVDRVPHKKAC